MSDQKETTRRYFDDIVQGYFQRYLTMPSAWECLSIILSMLPEQKPLTILDAGCGPGYVAGILTEQGHIVLGIDISKKMIECARTYHSLNPTFDVADVETFDTPLKFDVAIAKGLFEYLETDEKALQNINQLLKPKGYLIAEFRHAGFTHGDPNYVDPYPMKRRVHDPETLKLEAEKHGFKMLQIVFYHYHKGLTTPDAASAFVSLFQKVA